MVILAVLKKGRVLKSGKDHQARPLWLRAFPQQCGPGLDLAFGRYAYRTARRGIAGDPFEQTPSRSLQAAQGSLLQPVRESLNGRPILLGGSVPNTARQRRARSSLLQVERPTKPFFNWSASLSIGVTAPPPGRGKLIEFCLPEDVAAFAEARSYIGHGSCPGDTESLGKVVMGMPGDLVRVDPTAALKSDSAGRAMEHFPFGQYRVPAGKVWVHGTARNSFDSRYFGPVPIANIRASLEPLLTW